MSLIETLETRTLFAATVSSTLLTDLSNLTSDVMAAKTAYQRDGPILRSDVQTLRADAKPSSKPGDGLLLAELNVANAHFYNVTRADALRLFVKDSVAARVGFMDALLLSIHPNNVRLQAKVTADVALFNASTSALAAKLGTDGAALSAASAAALTAVSNAYPGNATIAADVTKLQSDGSAFLAAVSPSVQAAQAAQADLAQFLSDVAAGK
jgi:hypothetical protein